MVAVRPGAVDRQRRLLLPVRCPLEAGEGGGSHSSATGSGSACSLRRSLPEVADEVLELAGRAERRSRLLPARAVVCFVLALFLFSSSDSSGPPGYRVVLRTLAEKLRHLPGGIVQRLPASSALARARRRLGGKAFQESRVAGPTSTAQGPVDRPGRHAEGVRSRLIL
ncbi:transposase domain-containing protein [Streptomyces sp. NPDC058476]|uniref:transposase domain-containing protein n=1 Tax=Streptomyces sp. NPDC058476 TaxID=3346519 RepID=UPI0036613C8C